LNISQNTNIDTAPENTSSQNNIRNLCIAVSLVPVRNYELFARGKLVVLDLFLTLFGTAGSLTIPVGADNSRRIGVSQIAQASRSSRCAIGRISSETAPQQGHR
jgi:hypothetical protein